MTPAFELKLREHCAEMIRRIADGRVIPFFGPGVSLLNRSSGAPFDVGKSFPDSEELSLSIAGRVSYPLTWDDRQNLLRVSWYGDRFEPATLEDHLWKVFTAIDSNKVHDFFVQLPTQLEKKGYNPYQLIVTANYDRVLDDAFDLAREHYDVLTYIAKSDDESEEGKFRYRTYLLETERVDDPDDFQLPIDENVLGRTIILKIQGGVDWIERKKSSFAIADEDYIDYLARPNIPARNIPVQLLQKMAQCDFLFLGHSVSDWHQRLVLRSIIIIQPRKKLEEGSWAIMERPNEWDREYWKEYGVELLEVSLNDYVDALQAELNNLPDQSRGLTP